MINSGSSARDRSMADRCPDNGLQAWHGPTTGRELQRPHEPSDRRESPLQDKTRKTADLGRDCAAPSSPDSAANRIRATESLFARTINDFCNKIGTKRTFGDVSRLSAFEGKA